MHGEAADLVLQVHGVDAAVLVAGGLHVHLVAPLGQLGDGDVHPVGTHGDVALLAQVLALHDLDAVGGEHGLIAHAGGQAEGGVEGPRHGLGRVGVVGVDADVGHLEAQQGAAGLGTQGGDLVKVAGGDVGLGAHPAAAHGVDEGGGDELAQVLVVDTSGGDELHAAEGGGEGLQGGEAAVDVGGEELDHLQPQLHGGGDLRGGDAAGGDGHAVVHAPADDLLVKAGRDDELGPARHGLLALVQGDDGAGPHQHVGAAVGHGLDGVRGGGGAEGDLHDVDAAGEHGLGGGDGVLGVLNDHHRHHAGVPQSL